MYTTGRLSVSRQAVLESFQHFDVGHKGYISRHDLETRAEEQAFDSPRLLKRVRSDDEEEIQDSLPSSPLLVSNVLSAVEGSEDGKLSFVEWALAMQEVDLPMLLAQHLSPSQVADVLSYLGRTVTLSRLNFVQ